MRLKWAGSPDKARGRRGWVRRVAASFQRRIRYRVTRSGYLFAIAMVLVGVAALASANNLLFLILASMLATLMVSGFVSRLSLAGLELELILPEHIAARQPVAARVRLRNLKWFPSFAIRLSGRTAETVQIFDRDIVIPVAPGRSTVVVDIQAQFPRRGIHQENLFTVSTRFPFGFVERRARIAIRTEVVIYPALVASFAVESVLEQLRGELAQNQLGSGADFYRVRPYEFHESSRYLDWKISAHTGDLQVREFAREEQVEVYIFLDLRARAGESFERAVECCAYLIWKLSEESARLRFRTQDSDFVFPEQADVYTILRALALVRVKDDANIPFPAESDPQLLFTEAPDAWETAGWNAARTITPDSL